MSVFIQTASATNLGESATLQRVRLAALALLVAAVWMLQHPYAGISHDSQIYTLFALARLHPHLSHDLLLRFGSQDRYTLFSPVYAEAIRRWDLGPAAALLTFVSEIAFYGCSYLFIRHFAPTGLALLGVGFLASLSTDYGSHEFFHCIEDFLTPRLPAEALVLGGLAATFASRDVLGVLCLLFAMLMHPIIGSAGIAMLLYDRIAYQRPRAATALGIGAILVSFLLASVTRDGLLVRFDDPWLATVRESSPFLFPSMWSLRDWTRISVLVGVLVSALLTCQNDRARRLYAGSLVLALSGIVLTLIYCDFLRLVVLTEAQPWRWLWISTVVAIGLAPLIARDCWKHSLVARAVPIFLGAAWMLRDEPAGLELSLVAITCAAFAQRLRNTRTERLVLLGSTIMFAVVVIEYVAKQFSHHELNALGVSKVARAVHALHERGRDGVAYGVALTLVFYLCERTSIRVSAAVAGVTLFAGAAVGCVAFQSWTTVYFTTQRAARFAEWRRQIPIDAEVMWSEMPVGTWYLLDRPSYFSLAQVPGAIFSRAKAMEVRRRVYWIADSLKAGSSARAPSKPSDYRLPDPSYAGRGDARQLALICSDPQLAFIVSSRHLAPARFHPVVLDPTRPHEGLRLYRCADLQGKTHLPSRP